MAIHLRSHPYATGSLVVQMHSRLSKRTEQSRHPAVALTRIEACWKPLQKVECDLGRHPLPLAKCYWWCEKINGAGTASEQLWPLVAILGLFFANARSIFKIRIIKRFGFVFDMLHIAPTGRAVLLSLDMTRSLGRCGLANGVGPVFRQISMSRHRAW